MNNTEQTGQSGVRLSASWQTKFEILEKIGAGEKSLAKAMKSDSFKQLVSSEKRKISFNILAFLFGPFYYFSKQMWQKGAFILGAVWLYTLLLSVIEASLGATFSGLIWV